jgi:hypothetical protein
MFFRNLAMQYDKVISSKEHVERIFESKLPNEDIEILKNLKESQSEYIHPIKKEPETNTKQIILNNSNQKAAAISIADELRKLVNLKNEGIISEEEFNNLKQKYIKNFTDDK